MDSVDSRVKELAEKTLLRSTDEYDVIGFDVDHCLVQYNVPNLHTMTYKAMTDRLIADRGYPKALQQLTPEQMNFSENATICDFKTGCIVKLGEDGLVLRAYYGFHRMDQKEVLPRRFTRGIR